MIDVKAPLSHRQIGVLSVGLCAAILAVVGFALFREKPIDPRLLQLGADLKRLESTFTAFYKEHGAFPANVDTSVVPTGMESLTEDFRRPTPVGGHFDWEGPETWGFAAISIQKPSIPFSEFLALDRLIDDGSLYRGKFRFERNVYYWVIMEKPES